MRMKIIADKWFKVYKWKLKDKWFTIYKWKLITSERIKQIEKYLEYPNDLEN